MNISILLQMAADGFGERIGVGSKASGLSYSALLHHARSTATWLSENADGSVIVIDTNSAAVPLLLFGGALLSRPFVPVNFRLATEPLRSIVRRSAPGVAVVGEGVTSKIHDIPGVAVVPRTVFREAAANAEPWLADAADGDPDAVAVILFTSGTTGEPKAAVLRHRHLFSYITSTVEFGSAGEDDCALVSVPAYHIAGVSAILTSLYSGRRLYYLPQFEAKKWVEGARAERVTHAMVVPTMLDPLLDELEATGESLPTLRHLSYGGGRAPVTVVERAMRLLPHVDFVNAYGLTETSSTVAMLTPQDHRDAIGSADPDVRARIGSVGRPIESVQLQIRDLDGAPVPAGQPGEVWVRGEQIAGEYAGTGGRLRDGWFPTRDGGRLDAEGYLFLEGRMDDIIVRGGENMSPGEIEDALAAHPAVDEAAVVGVPDIEWGEAVAAVVVLRPGQQVSGAELQDWVTGRLRSTRRPQYVFFRENLPYNETGKLLRRALRAELALEISDVAGHAETSA